MIKLKSKEEIEIIKENSSLNFEIVTNNTSIPITTHNDINKLTEENNNENNNILQFTEDNTNKTYVILFSRNPKHLPIKKVFSIEFNKVEEIFICSLPT